MTSFVRPDRREAPRMRVFIVTVDIDKKKAYAKEHQNGGDVVIDLDTSVGPIVQWPAPSEEWYITKIQERWVLERRGQMGNLGLSRDGSEQGDQVWAVSGELTVNDKNGWLRTTPQDSGWQPLALTAPWSTQSFAGGVNVPIDIPWRYTGLRWRLLNKSIVYVNGTIAWDSASTASYISTIAMLPASFTTSDGEVINVRPSLGHIFMNTRASGSNQQIASIFIAIGVEASGKITTYSTSPTIARGDIYSIDMNFPIAL